MKEPLKEPEGIQRNPKEPEGTRGWSLSFLVCCVTQVKSKLISSQVGDSNFDLPYFAMLCKIEIQNVKIFTSLYHQTWQSRVFQAIQGVHF